MYVYINANQNVLFSHLGLKYSVTYDLISFLTIFHNSLALDYFHFCIYTPFLNHVLCHILKRLKVKKYSQY